MKKISIYLYAFLCFFNLSAQNFKLTWSPERTENFTEIQRKAINENHYCQNGFSEDPVKYASLSSGTSPDSTKSLNTWIEKNNLGKENESIQLYVEIKGDGKILHERNFELPYIADNLEFREKCILDDKMVYIIAFVTSNKKEIKVGKMLYSYRIFCINPVTGTIKDIMLNPEKKYVSEYTLYFDKNNKLKVFGFYSNNIRKNVYYRNVMGYFAFELENTSSPSKEIIVEGFGEEFYKQSHWPSFFGIGPYFHPKYIWHKGGFGCVIVMECDFTFNYSHKGYSTNNPTGLYSRDYSLDHVNTSQLYLDLIVLNIGENGKIISAIRIPKKQKVFDQSTIYSIYATYYNNKTYIIFNDHELNVINNDFREKTSEPELAQPVIIQVNEDGTYSKKAITKSYRDTGLKLDILLSGKVSDNEVMLVDPGAKKTKMLVGYLKIE